MPAKNKKIRFRDAVKYAIFATNILAILLLVSSLLAWRVSPLKTNLFSYIGLGFGVIFFVNVLYLVIWLLFSKWKLALISGLALLLCHQPILTFFPMHLFPKKAPENTIKVLSYNVQGFINEYKKNAPSHPTLDFIASTNADIVCLQEYFVSKTGQAFISQRDINRILNKYPYRSVTGLESSGKYHLLGLACFSKYPIEHTQEVVFKSSFNGAALYTIAIEGKKYTVANVHLESNSITAEDKKLYADFIQNNDSVKLDAVTSNIRRRLGSAFRQRVTQVEKVKTQIAEQQTDGVIICGDFNDTPISYTYAQMKKGLVDSYAATAFGPGITYHQDFFLFRIDYIMHSKNIQSYRAKVDKVKYADHYPIHTSLKLPTQVEQ